MPNRFQTKRTSTSGRTPNTTSSGNTQYIAAGELALNMTDQILYTSDGTNLLTVGANLVNQRITGSLTLDNDKQIRFKTVNTSAYAYFVQQNDDNFVFYTSNSTYGARAVFSIYANSSTSDFQLGQPVTFNGPNVKFSTTTALYANGSAGAAGQILTSNGTALYWSTPGAASVNTNAQWAWTNTHSFSANVTFTGNNINLPSNTGTLMFAGVSDTNWRIGRNTGGTTKFYYSNNTLDIIAAASNLEGFVIGQPGGNTYLETGYAGTFTKNPIYVGNATVNVTINSTSFSGTANNSVYLGGIGGGSYLRSDVNDQFSGAVLQVYNDTGVLGSVLTAANTLQIFQANVNADAFMTFHVSGDTAVHFGLDGTTNDLFVGGWSFGANKYKVWHQNNDGTGSGLDADFLDGIHAAAFVQNTDSRTLSGNLVFSANVTLNGLIANGAIGTAGQVLHSDGAKVYWATDDQGVTSVATGNGMTGGTITATGTVSVLANTGIVANATGVYVNSAYIGTLSANNTTYVNGKTEANLNVNSAARFTTARTLTIGTTGKSFDGTTNLSWTHTELGAEYRAPDSVPRSNLGDPTVREMAIFDSQFTNKTELYDINNLFFETSTDNVNWSTYSVTDAQKRLFLSGDAGYSSITIPNGTAYFRVRMRATAYVYLNALYSYWSGNGHTTQVQIFKKHDSGSWTQHTSSTTAVGAWPGHLYLPFSTIPWHPSGTLGSHFHEVYILFIPAWNGTYPTNNIDLYKFQLWGGYPAGRRNIFSTNEYGVATFPANVVAGTFVGNVVGTSNNASYLGGTLAANYVQNTDSRTLSGNLVFSANVTLNGLIANGAIGTAGQVLHSDGTKVYWAVDDQGVTSVATGSGLTGGTITTTGTLSVLANTGIIANATGLYVNSAYIATISANAATYLNGKTEGNLNVNNSLTSNNSTYAFGKSETGLNVNSALTANNSDYLDGFHAAVFVQNTDSRTLSGNLTFTANVTLNGLIANGAIGTAGQVLHSDGAKVYWSTDDQGVTSVASGNGISGGTITGTGTLYVTQGTGVVVNATGVHVNSAYIATIAANNASYLGGTLAANYVQNTDSRTLSGNLVFSGANVAFTGNARISGGLIANGSLGTSKQFLLSNGTSVYWATGDLSLFPDSTFKKSCKAATTADLGGVVATTTTLTASTLVALPAQDGITLAVGDRLLVKNQTSGAQNGIYEVTNLGSAGVTAWVLTRTAGADTVSELASALVAVDSGTVNGGHLFDNDLKTTDTLGTTAVNWYHVVDTGGATFTGNVVMGTGSTGIFPLSNTVGNSLGNTISRWALTATTGVFAGAVSGITTLAAGNTTVTGFVNATTVAAGANVYMNATHVFVSTNATMNTVITANQITLNGANVMTTATTLKVYNSAGAQVFP